MSDNGLMEVFFMLALFAIGFFAGAILADSVMPSKIIIEHNKDDCFHNFDLSYGCDKTGNYLLPRIINETRYWRCGDLYEVKAC